MKKTLLTVGILFTTQSFAAAPAITYCSSANLNFNGANSCTSTCSAISGSAVRLGSGTSGFCIGQSSYNEFNLYKIALGRETAGNEPICTIWTGNTIVSTADKLPGTSENSGAIDLSSCSSGSYDTIHLTSSNFQKYAGHTRFPDGSGNIVRTASAFANDNTDYTTIANWRETSTSHSNDALGYVRPSTGWNSVYNKLASAPSSTDLAGDTNRIMLFDWMKITKAGDTGERTGWLCDGESVCSRAAGENQYETRIRHTETMVVEGLPLTITDGDDTLSSLDVGYNSLASSARSGTEEVGINFLWHNDSGTLKYLGTRPFDDGLYVTIGTPQSTDM